MVLRRTGERERTPGCRERQDELQQTCAVKSGLVIDSLSQWVGQAGSRVSAGALVFL